MSLMVLGTASHVGKSLTVAGICRFLVNQGISVCPFKSQNMSLNSYVTKNGSEIGVAQAMQAFAARVEPEADMNPVLLKPKGDRTSQVVLLGKPYRDVYIGDYYRETAYLLEQSICAYQRLRTKYGNVVVEGAGGAAELNLYDRDIANILLARELKLPILLVADIERGGVFAQIYGTLELLPPDIRSQVFGVIINKFRGDPGLFEDGVKKIEEITDIPVLGVVPYAPIPLPSEDSLSIGDKKAGTFPVRIAVIRLPRISNFTDFEGLEQHAAVHYVAPGESLEGYDCVIIPGTKNTVEDLLDLWESGTAEEIIRVRNRGTPVIGICGGYQMLGKEVLDEGFESEKGNYRGLGLLDIVTTFGEYKKTTVQVERRAADISPILSNMGCVRGYEIHMGETRPGNIREAFAGDGAASEDGLVFGTYMHGLFHNAGAVNSLLSFLHQRKGIPFTDILSLDGEYVQSNGESSYEALARHFETYVDMEYIASFFRVQANMVGGNVKLTSGMEDVRWR
jgi:adenosylcobyric acid synthase